MPRAYRIDPEVAKARAAKGAKARWAKAAPGAGAAEARRMNAGRRAKLAREIDPDGMFTEDELRRLVDAREQERVIRASILGTRALQAKRAAAVAVAQTTTGTTPDADAYTVTPEATEETA